MSKYDLYRLREDIRHMITCDVELDANKLACAEGMVEDFVRDHIKVDDHEIERRAEEDAEREWCK